MVAFAFFTVLIGLIYNTSNSLVLEVFNFSDSLPAFNAWFFFIEDGFLPILGYLILIMVTKDIFSKKYSTIMGIHASLYIVGALLQLTWILSINYLRPLLMTVTLVSYIESCEDLAGFIVIDINHFKSINDTLGHLYGDEVLIKVAYKLELYFGNNDIIGRLGGDEFAIFSPHILQASELQEKAKLVVTVLEEIKINTPKKHVSASVGFSLYPEHSSYNTLYENSDQAMYRKKNELRQLLR